MENPHTPNITSFVIRFVHAETSEDGEAEASLCRGTIRHIQTNQELTFTHWSDAVEFMQRYVALK